MNKIKKIIRNAARTMVYGSKASPERYISSLRREGIEIGDGTVFFDPINTVVDIQNPKLLKIGRNVRVTSGCVILTHDFSWSVLSGVYGECLGGIGSVTIGNNVFLGVHTVVLCNSKIGDNVIIGAGSIVSGELEANAVYAGCPARRIMTLEEFYNKKKKRASKSIANIIKEVGSDSENIWEYLREYSCLLSDAPQHMQEQLMRDSGYFELCKKNTKHYWSMKLIKSQIDIEKDIV